METLGSVLSGARADQSQGSTTAELGQTDEQAVSLDQRVEMD